MHMSVPCFFFNMGTPGDWVFPLWGPKMAYTPGAAGKFWIVLIQTPRKNAICACPQRDPPPPQVPKKSDCLGTPPHTRGKAWSSQICAIKV